MSWRGRMSNPRATPGLGGDRGAVVADDPWTRAAGCWSSRSILGLAVVVIATVGKRAGVSGYSMARLELAGTAARATEIRAGVADELTRSAIGWDFWFIVGYVILIVVGALYFPARAYRVRTFRRFAVTACVLAIFAGVLDVIENIAMLTGLSSGSDRPWQIAATVSWAKWLILVVVVGYVLLAAFTFMITPAWVQNLLLNPPPPNVTLTADAGAEAGRSRPDRHPGSRHGARPGTGPVRHRRLRRRNQVRLPGARQPAGPRRRLSEARQPGTELGDGRQDRLGLRRLLHLRRHQHRPERAPAAALGGTNRTTCVPNRRRMLGGGTVPRRPTC